MILFRLLIFTTSTLIYILINYAHFSKAKAYKDVNAGLLLFIIYADHQ